MSGRRTQVRKKSTFSCKRLQRAFKKAEDLATSSGEEVMVSFTPKGKIYYFGASEIRSMVLRKRVEDVAKEAAVRGFDLDNFSLRELEEFKGKLLQILKLVAKPSNEPHLEASSGYDQSVDHSKGKEKELNGSPIPHDWLKL